EDGIRDFHVTGVQTCALPISVQENALNAALGRLFAVAENYPVLRASENFQQLQAELANTEDRIAAGRRFYNANVRELNTKVETRSEERRVGKEWRGGWWSWPR